MTCHACGAQLSANVRFCHKCGAAVAGVGTTSWRAGLPWGVAGAALGALLTVLVMRLAARQGAGSTEQPSSAPGSVLRAPDITQMSPEEQANRLFNRIMTLSEAGKRDSVQFFLPMALGAYGQLPTLDVDARYHLGLIHLAGGQSDGALAQADSIRRAIPTHLFADMLRADAYRQTGNRQGERRAYADFLRNETAELARNRPEYTDHQGPLGAFHTAASRP